MQEEEEPQNPSHEDVFEYLGCVWFGIIIE
jgi:hypothetical protein